MDAEHMEVAERLAEAYPELPPATVVHAVAHCAEQFPVSDPHFIEQAAMARLHEQRDGNEVASLKASLDDPELQAELTLSTRLIIAVNNSAERLSQHEIDRLLGSNPRGATDARRPNKLPRQADRPR